MYPTDELNLQRISRRQRQRSSVISVFLQRDLELRWSFKRRWNSGLGGRALDSINLRRPKSTWTDDYFWCESFIHVKGFQLTVWGTPSMFRRKNDDLKVNMPDYWGTRKPLNGKNWIESAIKVLVFLRLLSTGDADRMDNGCEMAGGTLRLYFIDTMKEIFEMFGVIYLNRRPTKI